MPSDANGSQAFSGPALGSDFEFAVSRDAASKLLVRRAVDLELNGSHKAEVIRALRELGAVDGRPTHADSRKAWSYLDSLDGPGREDAMKAYIRMASWHARLKRRESRGLQGREKRRAEMAMAMADAFSWDSRNAERCLKNGEPVVRHFEVLLERSVHEGVPVWRGGRYERLDYVADVRECTGANAIRSVFLVSESTLVPGSTAELSDGGVVEVVGNYDFTWNTRLYAKNDIHCFRLTAEEL